MLKSVAASGQRSNSLLNPEFAEYYDYEEPLPQGPTRPPVRLGNQQKQIQFPEEEYDYYYEDTLPQGPTREPPLPSGPTQRPGRARPAALQQVLSLPLLTTKRPRKLRLPDTE